MNLRDQTISSAVIDSAEAHDALVAADVQASLPADEIDIDQMKIAQHWERYSAEDREVWQTIFDKRMDQLQHDGSRIYLHGAEAIALSRTVNVEPLPGRDQSSTIGRASCRERVRKSVV